MRLSRVVVLSLVAVLCGGVLSSASASVLEIHFTGMDLNYSGNVLSDATAGNFIGSGLAAQADPLQSMVFYVDGVQQGTVLTNDLFLDTYIQGLSGIPELGGAVTTSGNGNAFGVDLLTSSTTPGEGIALQVDKFQFFYSGSKIAIATSGLSTGLWSQSLPFGMAFDPTQPISIVLSSSNLSNFTTAGGYVTGFRATGTGSITGTLVPEPASLLLLGLGGLGLLRRRFR